MSKKKKKAKKSTKTPIDWRQTIVGGIVDILVGTVLLLIAKLLGD